MNLLFGATEYEAKNDPDNVLVSRLEKNLDRTLLKMAELQHQTETKSDAMTIERRELFQMLNQVEKHEGIFLLTKVSNPYKKPTLFLL